MAQLARDPGITPSRKLSFGDLKTPVSKISKEQYLNSAPIDGNPHEVARALGLPSSQVKEAVLSAMAVRAKQQTNS